MPGGRTFTCLPRLRRRQASALEFCGMKGAFLLLRRRHRIGARRLRRISSGHPHNLGYGSSQ
jgi:hypothetical protein